MGTDTVHILLRLRGGYGLGDAVAFTVALKHLRKYRPDWKVDVQAPRGMHSAFHGLCQWAFADDEPVGEHDKDISLNLEDAWQPFPDRPSNKTVFNLRLLFGIGYDPTCAGYEIRVRPAAQIRARKWLLSVCGDQSIPGGPSKFQAVVVHYRGGSSKAKKDLDDWQAEVILDAIRQTGRTPILLDWQGSRLDAIRVPDQVWGGFGHGDAETMAALIRLCEGFVGIDSGPSKVASTTNAPALVCWTNHHPGRYHDPAPNTEHLIPDHWRVMCPIEDHPAREAYFRANYRFREYAGEHGIVAGVLDWLRETLRAEIVDPGIQFVVPGRIHSIAWALAKARRIAGGRPFGFIVSGTAGDTEAQGAAEFARTFDFLRFVKIADVPYHQGPERPQNTRGHYLYVSDGMRGGNYFLLPDQVMQTGKGLADWLPAYGVDWEVVKLFPEALLAEMEERGWLGARPLTA